MRRKFRLPTLNQYSNSDFSFWYPNAWTVESKTVNLADIYPGVVVINQIKLTNNQDVDMTINTVESPDWSITDDTSVGACSVCDPMKYGFDPVTQNWILNYPKGQDSGAAIGQNQI